MDKSRYFKVFFQYILLMFEQIIKIKKKLFIGFIFA